MGVSSQSKVRYAATFFVVILVLDIEGRVSVGGVGCKTGTCTNCCSLTSCVVLSASNYYALSSPSALTDCANTLKCQNGNPGNRQNVTQTYFIMGTATLDCPADGYTGPGTGTGGMQDGDPEKLLLATACIPGAT